MEKLTHVSNVCTHLQMILNICILSCPPNEWSERTLEVTPSHSLSHHSAQWRLVEPHLEQAIICLVLNLD